MNILELAIEAGLEPRKTSNIKGGEYHSPCPSCGGRDRFMFWPTKGRYWCRQCDAKGDAIQFCRHFQKLSFRDACLKVQEHLGDFHPSVLESRCKKQPIHPPLQLPSHSWEKKAVIFLEQSHKYLLSDKTAMELVLERGLSIDTIQKNQLGWNPSKIYHKLTDWGLEETEERKWLCLPKGIVIPMFESNSIRKLKIRKSKWQEEDFYGKYYEVPGSSNMLPIFGIHSKETVVITEAEFDAMLVVQEAGDLCNCIALGGAQKKPNLVLHEWLLTKKLILFALDFDDAGKKAYTYWKKSYPNLEPWPVPEEKSPGDYHVKKGDIREWVESGMKIYINNP